MKVISFEGFEYSGKSTQIKLLKKYFIKNNIKSTFTREPGGNKDLEKIRNVILKSNFDNLSLIMFFFASRFALLSSIKKNDFIVFDRFFDSTYAYQKYNSKEKKLIIHNAPFDVGFLNHELKALKKSERIKFENNNIIGSISKQQLKDIAEKKMEDLNAHDLDEAAKIIAGSARSMGIEVKE